VSVETVSEVRVYRAATMREALRLVREDLGSEALIVRTETLRTKRWFGKARIAGVEVHAQAGERSEEESDRPQFVRFPEKRSSANESRPAPAPKLSLPPNPVAMAAPLPQAPEPRPTESKNAIAEREARRTLRQALLRAEFPEAAIGAELDQLFANASAEERTQAATLLPILARRFAAALRVERGALPMPGESLRIALVGATGVGKTTTAAKLAARYSLHNGLRVGLVGVDTYRMGAVDQLEEYAKLLEVPLCVATSPSEMQQAMRRLGDCDVILVDTAGRSPLDARSVSELAGVLDAGEVDHVWIAASASTHAGAFATAIDKLSPLAPTGLVLTKLDEQVACGHLWLTLSTIDLPTFYLADGQRVPEDLAPADAKRIARALIGAPAKNDRANRTTRPSIESRTETFLKNAA
jgi:flagellar biosynthesis protein FlhF